jgi:hypothetical protein
MVGERGVRVLRIGAVPVADIAGCGYDVLGE